MIASSSARTALGRAADESPWRGSAVRRRVDELRRRRRSRRGAAACRALSSTAPARVDAQILTRALLTPRQTRATWSTRASRTSRRRTRGATASARRLSRAAVAEQPGGSQCDSSANSRGASAISERRRSRAGGARPPRSRPTGAPALAEGHLLAGPRELARGEEGGQARAPREVAWRPTARASQRPHVERRVGAALAGAHVLPPSPPPPAPAKPRAPPRCGSAPPPRPRGRPRARRRRGGDPASRRGRRPAGREEASPSAQATCVACASIDGRLEVASEGPSC